MAVPRSVVDKLAAGLAKALLREVEEINKDGGKLPASTAAAVIKFLDRIRIDGEKDGAPVPFIEPPKEESYEEKRASAAERLKTRLIAQGKWNPLPPLTEEQKATYRGKGENNGDSSG